jgi:acyl phosphate:glycerol-3-phosphate acyltransferase
MTVGTLALLQGAAIPTSGVMPWLAAIVVGYLLGSIPFGLVLTRAAGLGDVRNIGSGNIGATNVLRTGNKGLAAATLLLDGLKATAAVLIVHWVLKSAWGFSIDYMPGLLLTTEPAGYALARQAFFISSIGGAAAVIGHIFPVWLGFKGGKGVATYIGAALGVFWPAALFFCATWIAVAVITRISSLSALVAVVATPVYPFILGEKKLAMILAVLAALVVYKHHANIRRLLAGEEPRIGAKK